MCIYTHVCISLSLYMYTHMYMYMLVHVDVYVSSLRIHEWHSPKRNPLCENLCRYSLNHGVWVKLSVKVCPSEYADIC